jgi:hypothetical protein
MKTTPAAVDFVYWIVIGGVAFLHADHKRGLMCTTVYLLMSQSLIFVFVLGFTDDTIYVLHVFG